MINVKSLLVALLILALILNFVAKIFQASDEDLQLTRDLTELQFIIAPMIDSSGYNNLGDVKSKIDSMIISTYQLKLRYDSKKERESSAVMSDLTESLKYISGEISSINLQNLRWEERRSRILHINNILTKYQEMSPSRFRVSLVNVGMVIDSVFTWPVALIVGLFYLTISGLSMKKVADAMKPFKTVQMFNISLELGQEVRQAGDESIEEFRKVVKKKFNSAARKHDFKGMIEDIHKKEMSDWASRNGKQLPADVRITIHVEDLLFDESIYQLTDYYPKGGGSGRIFSVRYGIIGRAWRLNSSQIVGSIPTTSNKLIEDWGMTQDQAVSAGSGKTSMAALYICDVTKGTRLGIFYFDSGTGNAFGDQQSQNQDDRNLADDLESTIQAGIIRTGLTDALKSIKMELMGSLTGINIYAGN